MVEQQLFVDDLQAPAVTPQIQYGVYNPYHF